MANSLLLTLNKKSFDIMITGEKNVEYRNPSPWIISRLSKHYNTVKFINGYGSKMPYFVTEFLKWEINDIETEISYSNGHKAHLTKGLISIYLGQIIESGNL